MLLQTEHGVRTRCEKNGIVHYLHLILNGKFVFDTGLSEISVNVIICGAINLKHPSRRFNCGN